MHRILGSCVVVVVACASPSPDPAPPPAPAAAAPAAEPSRPVAEPDPSPVERERACQAIADWRPEVIELPPEFAPTLPAGREELRFAPGMFEADSAEYFTYAFVLGFRDPQALDRGAVEGLLDDYFRGLMAAVAKSRKTEVDTSAIKASVTGGKDRMHATVQLVDAFVTGKPFELRMVLDVDGSCLRARASPQPMGHAVWGALEHAIHCLPCE